MSVSGARGESAMLHLLLGHSAATKRGGWGGRAVKGRRGILRVKKQVMEERASNDTISVKPLCVQRKRKNLQEQRLWRAPQGKGLRGASFNFACMSPISVQPTSCFVTRVSKSGSRSFPQWEKDAGCN